MPASCSTWTSFEVHNPMLPQYGKFLLSLQGVWVASASTPSLGSHCRWCSFPFAFLPVHQTPSETASTVHVSGWLPLVVGSVRLFGSIVSHTTLKARLVPLGWPPSWCPSTHGRVGWVASAQLGSWPQICRRARPMPRLPAVVLAEAGEEAGAHRVSVGNLLSPIAMPMPITCQRPAVPGMWHAMVASWVTGLYSLGILFNRMF